MGPESTNLILQSCLGKVFASRELGAEGRGRGKKAQTLLFATSGSGGWFPTGIRWCLAPSSGREGEGAAGGRQARAGHRRSGECLGVALSSAASAGPFLVPTCSPHSPFLLLTSFFPFYFPASPQPSPPCPLCTPFPTSVPHLLLSPSSADMCLPPPRTWPTSHPGSQIGECCPCRTSAD